MGWRACQEAVLPSYRPAQPARMTMAGLLMGFPVGWAEQRATLEQKRLGFVSAASMLEP